VLILMYLGFFAVVLFAYPVFDHNRISGFQIRPRRLQLISSKRHRHCGIWHCGAAKMFALCSQLQRYIGGRGLDVVLSDRLLPWFSLLSLFQLPCNCWIASLANHIDYCWSVSSVGGHHLQSNVFSPTTHPVLPGISEGVFGSFFSRCWGLSTWYWG